MTNIRFRSKLVILLAAEKMLVPAGLELLLLYSITKSLLVPDLAWLVYCHLMKVHSNTAFRNIVLEYPTILILTLIPNPNPNPNLKHK